MPAFRNVRRSRRISRQPPRDPRSDEYDRFDLELMYPASPATYPEAALPPPDETGEPEVDPESPPSSPEQLAVDASQRTSHSRKKKPGHIPRPPNAFMIFRSDLWNKEKIKSTVERDHRQISRIAGNLWNSLTDAERAPYQHLAEEAKKEHARKYPQYKYSPIYRREKPAKRKPKQDHSEKVHHCLEVALLMQEGFVGDALKEELDRRQRAMAAEDRKPESSRHAEASSRRKASRSSSNRSSSRARPRRERRTRVKDEDEYIPAEHRRASLPASLVKAESISPEFKQSDEPPVDEDQMFVPEEGISDLDLDAVPNEVKEECADSRPPTPTTPQRPFDDSLCPLSEDFLAYGVEDSAIHSSPSMDEFADCFNDPVSTHDGPPSGGIFSPLCDDTTYFTYEYAPQTLGFSSSPDFSEWMQYDE
ncbi:hypothetical protein C8Q77DRAFT_1069169 [Trametes polyzona]|nr:hypothetical protein C8Q77DRAFT_1069169 [Trametes polyzona]